MQVTVKLFASLSRFSDGGASGKPFQVDLAQPATLQKLVERLGIPAEEAKVAFVNGRIRDLDWILEAGDQVGIFPPIGGG